MDELCGSTVQLLRDKPYHRRHNPSSRILREALMTVTTVPACPACASLATIQTFERYGTCAYFCSECEHAWSTDDPPLPAGGHRSIDAYALRTWQPHSVRFR